MISARCAILSMLVIWFTIVKFVTSPTSVVSRNVNTSSLTKIRPVSVQSLGDALTNLCPMRWETTAMSPSLSHALKGTNR